MGSPLYHPFSPSNGVTIDKVDTWLQRSDIISSHIEYSTSLNGHVT